MCVSAENIFNNRCLNTAKSSVVIDVSCIHMSSFMYLLMKKRYPNLQLRSDFSIRLGSVPRSRAVRSMAQAPLGNCCLKLDQLLLRGLKSLACHAPTPALQSLWAPMEGNLWGGLYRGSQAAPHPLQPPLGTSAPAATGKNHNSQHARQAPQHAQLPSQTNSFTHEHPTSSRMSTYPVPA